MKAIGNIVNPAIADALKKAMPEQQPSKAAIQFAGSVMRGRGWEERQGLPFDELAEWLAATQEGLGRRGLFLRGNVGNGKTMFLQKVLKLKIMTGEEIGDIWRAGGYASGAAFWYSVCGVWDSKTWQCNHFVIDELGFDKDGQARTTDKILASVIARRYRDWQDNGCRTYITSNLKDEEIDLRFGDRTSDRLVEMCRVIEFNGESQRGRG